MVDGAFYAQKCYAQKCYYWVRDQKKIKSNELVVTTVVIDVLGIYDIKIAQEMYSTLPPTNVILMPPATYMENYEILQNRLNLYGRAVVEMVWRDTYFSAFSHQCWNTQEYSLFARIATLEFMKANVDSYVKDYSKKNARGTMQRDLDKLATPGKNGRYSYPGDLVIRGSCDLNPDTNVLYLAACASSVVTISHLSDIVGTEGNVYVAFQHIHDICNGITVEVLRQRTNVHILEGVDITVIPPQINDL